MLNFNEVEPQEKYLCLGSKHFLSFVIWFTPFGANDFFSKVRRWQFTNVPGERAIPQNRLTIPRWGVEAAAAPTNTRIGELNSNVCSKINTNWSVRLDAETGQRQRQRLQAKAILHIS